MTDVASLPQSPVRPFVRPFVLVIGANARLGRFLDRAWKTPPPFGVIWQARQVQTGQNTCVIDPLADPAALAQVARGTTAVLNLAGVVPGRAGRTGGTGRTYLDQDLSLNSDLALAALRAAQTGGVEDVFLLSSAAVYGAPEDATPLHESRALTPANAYGHAKAAMEDAAQNFAAQHGDLRLHILRLGNVAGADMLLGGAGSAPVVLDQFADGRFPTRSYIGPATMAAVFASLLSAPKTIPEVLNIAAPDVVAMDALLAAANIPYRPRPAPAGALPVVALCTENLQRIHAFQPAQSSAPAMVAEWQALKIPGQTPE